MSTSSSATVLSGVPTNAEFGAFLTTRIAAASAAPSKPIALLSGAARSPERAGTKAYQTFAETVGCPPASADLSAFTVLEDKALVRAAASILTTETMHVALLIAALSEGLPYRECLS